MIRLWTYYERLADYDQIMSSSSVERHKQMQEKEKEEQIMSGLWADYAHVMSG